MNFADIAKKQLSEIERPPLPPIGMYRWQVTKIPAAEDSGDKLWTSLRFPVKAIEAYDNVDADELRKFGGIKNVVSSVQFLFDNSDTTKFQQTEFRLKTFLEKHLQVENAANMSLGEALTAALNCQCDGEFAHRPDKNDRELVYGEIRKTSPVRE